MLRAKKHIALVLMLAFAVSTAGLPVAVYFCTMQKAFRTGECCCACPATASPSGEKISARACVEASEIGAPIKAAFTSVKAQHVTMEKTIFAVLPEIQLHNSTFIRFSAAAHCRDGIPPPLLRTSILQI